MILQIHLSKLSPTVNSVWHHTIVQHQRIISELIRQRAPQRNEHKAAFQGAGMPPPF